MSRVRTRTPIEEVDRIAEEEGLELFDTGSGRAREFTAFDREYVIREQRAGKVGLFHLTAETRDGRNRYEEAGMTRGRIRKLFRAARERGGARAAR